MRKVGILTSGGDCQGLNSAIRGVAKALYHTLGDSVEIWGIADGFRGLIEGEYKRMRPEDFSGILTLGGTILGTSRQPFKLMRVIDETGVDKVEAMKKTYRKMGLDALVILGGNGTQKTANLLSGEGLNVVSLPKTIDNDVFGTEVTFGYHSAVEIATGVLDCLHTTATSHGRVFIVEIMGNKAGWLTLSAGLAGGADAILIPEIPYDPRRVREMLEERARRGKEFSILAVAEGAISREESELSKKELKARRAADPAPSAAYRLMREINADSKYEMRVTVPGHFQRGGAPCAYDRVLTTRFGAAAAELVCSEQYGRMVALQSEKITSVLLSETAGRARHVPLDAGEVQAARAIGLCLGD